MSSNRDFSNDKSSNNRLWQYIRKNGFTILMVIFIGVMFVSPDAKSFVLRQLMATGLFNPSIEDEAVYQESNTHVGFDFTDENRNIRNTSSLRGKVVFINFWASWCPPCRAEFPSIEILYSKFKDNPDVFFLTINEDNDMDIAKKYLINEKYSIPIFKTKGYVPEEIYSGALPTTVVLDKHGKIRYHNTGFANYASDKFVKQIEDMIVE